MTMINNWKIITIIIEGWETMWMKTLKEVGKKASSVSVSERRKRISYIWLSGLKVISLYKRLQKTSEWPKCWVKLTTVP